MTESDNGIRTARAPRSPVFRIGHGPDPFAPPSWAFVQANGTLGGRFDDPGSRQGIAPADRFRVLYFASERAGAFGETLARFRPDIEALAQSGSDASTSRLGKTVVPIAWRQARRIGATVLAPSLVFADLAEAETIQALRRPLATLAVSLGLKDIDVSALTGPHRALTQGAARYLYEQEASSGKPLYQGIRYQSRFYGGWECWAVFMDRLSHHVVRVDPINVNDPGLYDAARILGLSIEDSRRRRAQGRL